MGNRESNIMQEFLAVVFSFFTIPLMNKKNIPIGFAICICAILMALTGGLGLSAFREVLADTFLNIRKVQQYIIIIEVCILGFLLGKYKIIDKVIHYLTMIVSSRRITLMSIPALVGLLSVPGGAIISVPFVDRIGDEANLSNVQIAIINLVYRHIAMHVMPYSSGFLLVASLAPQISLYKLAGLNGIFVLFYVLIAYFLYVVRVPNTKSVSTKSVSTKSDIAQFNSVIKIYFACIFGCTFKSLFTGSILLWFIGQFDGCVFTSSCQNLFYRYDPWF